MIRILSILFTTAISSMYFYSFGLHALPPSINTKLILAVVGLAMFILNSLNKYKLEFSRELIIASLIAGAFSIITVISSEINHTDDYSYSDYFFSFFVWIFGAYPIAYAIRKLHGEFNIKYLTYYLTAASVFQCIIALIIDKSPSVKTTVDNVILQGADFLTSVNRLYGIGASLDTAGVRFSVVLILISYILMYEPEIRKNTGTLILLITSFIIITIIGNMISRTTTTGTLLALGALILFGGFLRLTIKASDIKIFSVFFTVVAIFIAISTFLYQTNPYYTDLFRFAFEGFFNWVETGEWSTGSTDKLDAIMWVWPTDFKTWMIGSGIFGLYAFSTDIGYCRFVLYTGLIGFVTFVFLFIYNTFVFMKRFPKYRMMFITLLALAFIIWIKVATDIFFIFAMFYWLDKENEQTENEETATFETSELT